MGRMPSADYGVAVSVYEEPAPGEGEPEPVESAGHQLVDLQLAAPMSRGTKIALWSLAVVGMLLALGVGYGFGKVMRDRQVSNEVVVAAGRMMDLIRPITESIDQMNQALEELPDDYAPVLHQVFEEFCGGSQQPAISVHHLSDGRTLMTTGEQITGTLLDYVVQTQILAAICRQHLSKTAADMRYINTLLEAQQDTANYGVVFELGEISEGWTTFTADPDNATYTPPRGTVVTYEDLEMVTQGEGEERSFSYRVTYANLPRQVPLYNLVTLPREALIENPNEETALDRYRGRVQAIRSHVASLVQMQAMLMEGLTAVSERRHHFAL